MHEDAGVISSDYGIGSQVPLSDLLNDLIIYSDNDAGHILYENLGGWKEYKEAKSATVIMRTARQILEYYFIQISGYEGQTLTDRIMKRKDEFLEIRPDWTENREKQHLLNALLRYIGAENQRFNDGLDYVEDAEYIDQIRYTFKLIFDVMEQNQHYDMMMTPA